MNACLDGCKYSSIQRAIDNANSGDTINIAAGTYNENVEINKSLTVHGAGADKTKIVGHSGSVVAIDGVTATLSDMTITGGSAEVGGGIYNNGILNLIGVSVDHNNANHAAGGIYNYGTANLTDSHINYNTVSTFGGGILNDGQLAMKGGSADHNNAQDGGGIFNAGTMTLTSVSIRNNTAPGWGGGGIDNTGTIAIKGCTISMNAAHGTNTAVGPAPGHEGDPIGMAGAIWNDDGKAIITNSIITGNKANVGAGIYTDGDPGRDSASMTLIGSSVDHNTANMYAGGIYNWGLLTLNSSSVSYNTAVTDGGGIYNDGSNGMLTMKSGSVDHNAAKNGGGIYNYGTLTGNTDIVHNNSPNDISS